MVGAFPFLIELRGVLFRRIANLLEFNQSLDHISYSHSLFRSINNSSNQEESLMSATERITVKVLWLLISLMPRESSLTDPTWREFFTQLADFNSQTSNWIYKEELEPELFSRPPRRKRWWPNGTRHLLPKRLPDMPLDPPSPTWRDSRSWSKESKDPMLSKRSQRRPLRSEKLELAPLPHALDQ